jgi:glycerol-3-phosphate acyltransferase PlsY
MAYFLHFLFISAASNLASEAATVTARLNNPYSFASTRTKLIFVLVTWAVPAILTAIMTGFKHEPNIVDPYQPM